MALGWPAVLTDHDVTVRPLRMRDGPSWVEARRRNRDWLRPWEATSPTGSVVFGDSMGVFVAMTRRLRAEARRGEALPFALVVDGELAGQVTVSSVVRGSLQSASVGYWIDQRVAGRGITPTAVALVVDHCLGEVGLHRVEINIRPENHASRRVVEKLGIRSEGLRERFLHIDGEWRDHLTFAVLSGEVPGGLSRRWHASR